MLIVLSLRALNYIALNGADEPTNHLDLHALVWLENWLSLNFDGMAIVVSHDQYFLNAVCTDVLELRSTLAGPYSLVHHVHTHLCIYTLI